MQTEKFSKSELKNIEFLFFIITLLRVKYRFRVLKIKKSEKEYPETANKKESDKWNSILTTLFLYMI